MRRTIRRIWRQTRGVTSLEFALLLPVIAIVAAGTVEFGRLVILTQKLQNGTFILADLAARDKTLSVGQLDSIFLALDNIVQPFNMDASGNAIVTGIRVDSDGDPMINWQRSGAGSLGATSEIGAPGDVADLPPILEVAEGETIIVSEVFFDFVPIFGLSAQAGVFRKVAYVKPRLGTLETLLP
jgi:Flp pilus assembly protein TadG